MPAFDFERVLFVVGDPNTGKSTQLRSMFRDTRFGKMGIIPTDNKLSDFYRLSNERCLYLRLTSPHEMNESANEFLKKTATKIAAKIPRLGSRWNFACPLQPNKENKMPDVVDTCLKFANYFRTERMRVVFLNPNWRGDSLPRSAYIGFIDRLRKVPSVEICSIDARDRTVNGLFLADFFDFT